MSTASTPRQHYQAALAAGDFQPDPAQARVVEHLDALHRTLMQARERSAFWRRSPAVRGLYLWGPVGTGKTWLMDLFYDALPLEHKQRLHFHRFMQHIHEGLRKEKARRDPMARVAALWADRARLICLDEFQVTDIGDAMLLAGLLEGLQQHRVTLVATSNTPPQELYQGGLQRQRFLPAIDRIQEMMDTVALEAATDYRLRILTRAPSWHCPPGPKSAEALARTFERLNPGSLCPQTIAVNGRQLTAVRRGDGVIWFTFDHLCRDALGNSDYLELALRFNTLVLQGIPVMDADDDDAARRFIHLVDTLYDHRVKLIVSAAAEPEALYRGRRLQQPFRRCASRLTEMRSREYMATAHRC